MFVFYYLHYVLWYVLQCGMYSCLFFLPVCGLQKESICSTLFYKMIKYSIKDLYEESRGLIDVVVPFLKGRVSVDEKTKELHLASDLLDEKSRIKVLLYMLGKKVVALSVSDLDSGPGQCAASAKSTIASLHISKGQADGAFQALKREGMIEVFDRGKKGEVFYHIPDYRVLQAIKIVENALVVPGDS